MNPIEPASVLSWRARLLVAALALIPATVWGQAGYVHELAGDARVRTGLGAAVALKAGDTFVQGTIFETSANGRMVIKFEDGQIAALQPNSTFRVDQYRYDPRNARASGSDIVLVRGASRFVTGLIGSTNRQALRLAVGGFKVHLRGTDITLLAETAPKPTQAAAINLGAVLLETGHGTITLSTSQFTTMATGELPNSAAPISVAPAAMQAVVKTLAATSLPNNLPVVIASAARAAEAVAQARVAAANAASNPTNLQFRNAAEATRSAAAEATRIATSQAAAAYSAAILAGYLPPTPPAFSSPTQQALAPAAPEPTLPVLGCTGSPC